METRALKHDPILMRVCIHCWTTVVCSEPIQKWSWEKLRYRDFFYFSPL
uniref:Uncharacterized protein n=1 Tax=Arundo donax TaxID=35708 RepID=A0A0A9C2R3_ARUDO